MTPAVRGFALLLTLALAGPVAVAQQRPQPMTEAEKQQEFNAIFRAGLEALTARQLDQAERLFQACVQLYPEHPTAYYNLACGYSLGGKSAQAITKVREAFARGFNDLAHIARDTDLDAIRKTPEFRAAVADMEQAALKDVPEALSRVPEGKDPFPLLVVLHDDGQDPQGMLQIARETLSPEWGILVPQGPVAGQAGTRAWDGRCEWLVTRAVRAFLDGQPRVDKRRVVVLGEGRAGYRALGLARYPELYAGFLAAGPALNGELDGVRLSGLRAYLVVQKGEREEVEAGVRTRDAFLDANSPVVLERYPIDHPFSRDRALLLRALSWVLGNEVPLPGAGAEVPF